ncbi:hypothetical protein CA54_04310 [Symmachiella macrocystis]|uniref:Uncharacterized protein n=1 Tax=Symmachiella macrocystis TaxID=2527985 RepID=A0A5C6BHK2_9PLAN|nr:hypothetical protein [Symmachiella macrocystis]TWU11623.1 hypothetical protein CA54_04310 [Symmachiella macrocystis]
MNRRFVWAFIAILGASVLSAPQTASAQGLIWNLPEEDGTWVRYEGDFKNVEARPDDDEDLTIECKRWLTISSVGTETREYQGKEVPCRWIELKVETGRSSAEGVDTGRFGTILYKVLIPEQSVIGKITDEDDIPVTFLPILEGYRKSGDRPVKKVTEKVLAVYPMISLIDHYRDFKAKTKEPEPIDVKLGTVPARLYEGIKLSETETSRTKNVADVALSTEVPFGVAQWSVTVERDEKDQLEDVEQFRRTSRLEVKMEAVETGSNARSAIQTPTNN